MDYPKLNDHWHVQYGEAVGKEYNIIVKVIENKKELNPPNWRKNGFKCEHKNQIMNIKGEFFVELLLSGTKVFSETVSPLGIGILSGRL